MTAEAKKKRSIRGSGDYVGSRRNDTYFRIVRFATEARARIVRSGMGRRDMVAVAADNRRHHKIKF